MQQFSSFKELMESIKCSAENGASGKSLGLFHESDPVDTAAVAGLRSLGYTLTGDWANPDGASLFVSLTESNDPHEGLPDGLERYTAHAMVSIRRASIAIDRRAITKRDLSDAREFFEELSSEG